MSAARPDAPAIQAEDVSEGLQALIRALRLLFFLLRILIVGIFVYLVFSGAFFVREDEEAMLFTFGRLTPKDGHDVLTRGKWYWAWPYPANRVKRVPAQRSVTVKTRTLFWPVEDANAIETHDEDAEHRAEVGLVPGYGGYLLTGDANIMHMEWIATYRISDAKRYYLHFFDDSEAVEAEVQDDGHGHAPPTERRGTEAIIESLLANAVLTEVATWPVDSVRVLARDGVERLTLEKAVEARLRRELERLELGIELQQATPDRVQPPVATAAAFAEVASAAQDYGVEIGAAQAYENSVIPDAEGQASAILAEAAAYRTRVVESVKAEAGYFKTVLAEYQKNPRTMLVTLHADTIRDVLNRAEEKYIIHGKRDGGQEIRLLIGPEPKRAGPEAAFEPMPGPSGAQPSPAAAPLHGAGGGSDGQHNH